MTSAFIDTNVLLYSISRNPAEAHKRARAEQLLDRTDLILSTQVLQEFYVQATRPSRSDAIPHEIAAGLIRSWLRFPVQDVTPAIVISALDIRARYGFSYWDAAIIAAAVARGCARLYTEDLSDGQVIGSMTIMDPFRA